MGNEEDDDLEALSSSHPSNGDQGKNQNSSNYPLKSPGHQCCLEIMKAIMLLTKMMMRTMLFMAMIILVTLEEEDAEPFL